MYAPLAETLVERSQKLIAWVALLLVAVTVAMGSFALDNAAGGPAQRRKTGFCGNSRGVSSPRTARGKELFLNNCASCHNKNMTADMTGPALGRVEENWSAFPQRDLFEFIRHSQKSIARRQPRAVAVWKKFRPEVMPDFPGLSDEQIEDVLAYTR